MSTLYIERFGISFYSVDARARWNGGGIKILSVDQSAEMLAQTHYGDTLLTANSI
jgi:hypothetical protein